MKKYMLGFLCVVGGAVNAGQGRGVDSSEVFVGAVVVASAVLGAQAMRAGMKSPRALMAMGAVGAAGVAVMLTEEMFSSLAKQRLNTVEEMTVEKLDQKTDYWQKYGSEYSEMENACWEELIAEDRDNVNALVRESKSLSERLNPFTA